jgi:hypothetical protein
MPKHAGLGFLDQPSDDLALDLEGHCCHHHSARDGNSERRFFWEGWRAARGATKSALDRVARRNERKQRKGHRRTKKGVTNRKIRGAQCRSASRYASAGSTSSVQADRKAGGSRFRNAVEMVGSFTHDRAWRTLGAPRRVRPKGRDDVALDLADRRHGRCARRLGTLSISSAGAVRLAHHHTSCVRQTVTCCGTKGRSAVVALGRKLRLLSESDCCLATEDVPQ